MKPDAFSQRGENAHENAAPRKLRAIVWLLRRDRRFSGIPLREFELLFADVHADIERRLFDALRDRVSG